MSEPDANGWLDISTAPKDGSRVLVSRIKITSPLKHVVIVARYEGRSWRLDDGNRIPESGLSGWQPLPSSQTRNQTMSDWTPNTPESCRAMALAAGQKASMFWMAGLPSDASKSIERARELTLLALKLESDAALSQANPPSTPPEGREQNT